MRPSSRVALHGESESARRATHSRSKRHWASMKGCVSPSSRRVARSVSQRHWPSMTDCSLLVSTNCSKEGCSAGRAAASFSLAFFHCLFNCCLVHGSTTAGDRSEVKGVNVSSRRGVVDMSAQDKPASRSSSHQLVSRSPETVLTRAAAASQSPSNLVSDVDLDIDTAARGNSNSIGNDGHGE
jgi:hypothetical protein